MTIRITPYLLTVAVLHKKRSRPVRLLLTPLADEARDEQEGSAPDSFAVEYIYLPG